MAGDFQSYSFVTARDDDRAIRAFEKELVIIDIIKD
ncbi:hypothetical protein PENARI_c065G10478 [Penicillium arizonense]|uniref:Uncharacterized protein n=1 Tax=Penicillium arizonense TaxID=1835702 RepID=A0A1F5L1M1_PENAI|nr:hypothetical protein PENARI_c065G10478 [Penicillium arizonense]OGE47095.1 hypothetical protein PENARI_c065G10478 [Penicillium arizonense]